MNPTLQRRTFFGRLQPLFGIVGFLWLLEFIDIIFFGQRLDLLGIRPRSIEGLWGVLFAPLLHGGLGHVAANSLPFIVLGSFVMLGGVGRFVQTTAIVWLVGGLGTWLTGGANSVHIGASIIVFGYLGYLLAQAYYERSRASLGVALVVGFLYGGMLFGVLPTRAGVSWQGHLFGVIGGVYAARSAAGPGRRRLHRALSSK